MQRTILSAIGILGLLSSVLQAQVPQIINYQGRVIVGTTNFSGTGSFKFALVNSNGSITYWSNDGTSSAGSQPTNAVLLTVTNGLYSVVLGDIGYSNMTVVPASVFSNNDVRLRVWFNDGTRGSQLLSPDQRITANGYAMVAASVSDGAITSAKIANNAITSLQLATGAVGTAQLADGGITSAKIANNAITSGQLGLGAVTTSNIALGSIGAAQIGDGTITAVKIGGGQLVKSLNGLTDAVTLAAGSNISITPSGNTLTLAGPPTTWRLNGANTYFLNGNVGIGINNPSSSLHINTTDDAIRLTATTPYITFEDSGSGGYSRIQGYASGLDLKAQDAVTGTNSGAFIHLDGTGRLGLGTLNPAHQLTIVSNIGTPAWTSNGWLGAMALDNGSAIAWQTNSAGQRFGMGHTNGSFAMFRTASNPGNTSSSATYDMVITDAGNVGVGTTGPAAKLQVVSGGNINTPQAQLTQTTSGDYARLRFTATGSSSSWDIAAGSTAGVLNFYAGSTAKNVMSLNANGTVSVPVLSITGGSDVAEPFPMEDEKVEKGSVVVIDEQNPGRLKSSHIAYDKRVAGIVSGANGVNPGIALHQNGVLDQGQNVALSGRVYVRAEASQAPIRPGDLLTTSNLPGRAMRASDPSQAQGAILGKAMSELDEGEGFVLVLVSLQ